MKKSIVINNGVSHRKRSFTVSLPGKVKGMVFKVPTHLPTYCCNGPELCSEYNDSNIMNVATTTFRGHLRAMIPDESMP